MRKLTPFLISLFLIACNTDVQTMPPGQTDGYAPVYALPVDVNRIGYEPAHRTELAGKIYASGNYLFENDVNKGIHIIDASNKNQVRKLGFINVPYSTEIAVKGNFLYTNNLNDLVVFDISNINNPTLVKRIGNVFPVVNQKYPPQSNMSFECPDQKKGLIVRWEKKILTNPKCRR